DILNGIGAAATVGKVTSVDGDRLLAAVDGKPQGGDTSSVSVDETNSGDRVTMSVPALRELVKQQENEGNADTPANDTSQRTNSLPKGKKKPIGRPKESDPKHDERIFNAWKTKRYNTYAECASALGITGSKPERQVKLAVDRHRKRRN